MRIAPTPDHVVERRWREWREERYENTQRKHDNRAIKGRDLVMRLDHGRRWWEFRGRKYGVPTIPWPLFTDMLDVQQRYDALVRQGKRYIEDPENPPPDPNEWRAVYREVSRLFKRACHPYGWRRLVWWLTPSPLRNAPPSEVGKALAFFSVCRTQDELEFSLREASREPSGTWPPASSGSFKPTLLSARDGGGSSASFGPSRRKRSGQGSKR